MNMAPMSLQPLPHHLPIVLFLEDNPQHSHLQSFLRAVRLEQCSFFFWCLFLAFRSIHFLSRHFVAVIYCLPGLYSGLAARTRSRLRR